MAIINKIRSLAQESSLVVVILAIGVALGGYFIGNGIYRSLTTRTVTVKGLAEQDVIADMAVWNINFNRVGGSLVKLQQDVDADTENIVTFLQHSGFNASEIQKKRIQVRDKFAGYSDAELKTQSNEGRYVIEAGIMVRSSNVFLVESTAQQMGDLVRQGISITEDYSGPTYIFNGLNDIKIAMIEQATKNAQQAGEQFAKDADAKLGDIKTANQGVFSIESRDPVDRWSNDEKQSINKKVRVVSTVTFYLK